MTKMDKPSAFSRRALLKGAGALVVSVGSPLSLDALLAINAAYAQGTKPPLMPDQLSSYIAINADGTLSNKTLFCDLGSDGMTIDDHGNVYLTGKGVTVFDKSGKQIAHIDIKEPWTANICFGGKEKDTLFVTASKAVYTVKMQVKGAGSQ